MVDSARTGRSQGWSGPIPKRSRPHPTAAGRSARVMGPGEDPVPRVTAARASVDAVARVPGVDLRGPTSGGERVRQLLRRPGESREGPPVDGQHVLHAEQLGDRKSTRLNSSHVEISYAVFCLKKKKKNKRKKHKG